MPSSAVPSARTNATGTSDTLVKDDFFLTLRPVPSLRLTPHLKYKQPRISNDFGGNELLYVIRLLVQENYYEICSIRCLLSVRK